MLMPRTKTTTFRASLGSVRRVNVYNSYSFRLSFIFNKLLKLIKRPTIQSRANAPFALDSFSYIGQVFKHNNIGFKPNRLFNYFFANNVIRFFNVSSFSAGDSLQAAFSRRRTIGLKFFSSCKKLISFVSKLSTSIDRAVRRCGKIVFANVNSYNFPFFFKSNIGDIQYDIKKPPFSFSNKFSLFNSSLFKICSLKFPKFKSTFHTSFKRKQRKNICFEGKRSLVVMDASGFLKRNYRDVLRFFDFKNFVSRTNFFNRVTNHLRAKRRDFFPNFVITQVMQSNTIPTSVFRCKGSSFIARFCKLYLRFKQSVRLFFNQNKFKCYSSFHIGNIKAIKELKQQKKGRSFLPTAKAEGIHFVNLMKTIISKNLISTKNCIKRDGSVKKFDINKVKQVITWAADSLDINPLKLESSIDIIFKDNIKTTEIQDNLIYHALSLTNVKEPDWRIVAGRLLMMNKWKDTQRKRGYLYGDLISHIKKMCLIKRYDKKI